MKFHRMKHGLLTVIAGMPAFNVMSVVAENSASPAMPNVVIINADDLGYGDVGCYGARKIQTPHMDQLAEEGRRFTDAHSASAVCTPSRYALLTGEYPFRRNLWNPTRPTTPLLIEAGKMTLGQLFKNEGYSTAIIGKWHLGFGETACDWNEPLRPGPLECGFDYFFGIPMANSGFLYVYIEQDRIFGWDPEDPLLFKGHRNFPPEKGGTRLPDDPQVFENSPISPTPEYPEKGPNRYAGARKAHELYKDEEVATTFVEKSVQWIEAHKDQPFFLYLNPTNIHHPFTPHPRFQGTSQVGLYGDYVHELDWMVGEVMQTLKRLKLDANTLVIVTSDNGGMFNAGGRKAHSMGHKLNGDLLGYKFGIWEGGHRVPFIAKWPGRIPAGTVSDQLLCNVDLGATLASILGASYEAADFPDSVDLKEAFFGEPKKQLRENLVLCPRNETHIGVRSGKWMFIDSRGDGGEALKERGGPRAVAASGQRNSDITPTGTIRKNAPKYQLYDLEADPSQSSNIALKHPEIVKQMQALKRRILAGKQ